MTDRRREILEWAEQGRLAPEDVRRALKLAGVLPSGGDWRLFLDRMLLWMGSVMTAAGVIFFLAYNWNEIGHFTKFGMVEAALVATLFLVWKLGLERPAGKAALLAGAVLVGAIFALIGQTYQTGADSFELFATWAVLIVPWILVGRFAALCVLWLLLVNLAVTLYTTAYHGFTGLVFGPERLLWQLLGLNTAALAVWEILAAYGVPWLRERWAARLIITAGGALCTVLAVSDLCLRRGSSGWGLPVWLAWLASVYVVYRFRIKDLYALAGGVLSVIVTVTCFLMEHMLRDHQAGSFLFIGLVVIALSAAGGWWLKRVAAEEKR